MMPFYSPGPISPIDHSRRCPVGKMHAHPRSFLSSLASLIIQLLIVQRTFVRLFAFPYCKGLAKPGSTVLSTLFQKLIRIRHFNPYFSFAKIRRHEPKNVARRLPALKALPHSIPPRSPLVRHILRHIKGMPLVGPELACLYTALGQNKKAIQAYEDILADDPTMAEALFNLAYLRAMKNDYPRAEVLYHRLVAPPLFG